MVGACPYPVPQGSQVYLRETALGLAKRGHDVHLVVYGHGRGDDASGLPIHRAANIPGARRTDAGPSLAKPLEDAALVAALRRVVRDERIDIVHAHNYEALLVALAVRKRPLIYHAHNAMADELPYFVRPSRWAGQVGTWLDRTFPRRADRVVVPHNALAAYLAGWGCPLDRLVVVPPPVEPSVFTECAIGNDVPPVLYTGNLDAYQNLELLERAMARVREELPEARLVVATAAEGGLPGAEIVPTPDVDTLRIVLARDAVFACPRVSWCGYPIKLLNAMAAGMAIVACQSAAHPLTGGENALVVPDNDAQAFAQALLALLRSPGERARLGHAARRTAVLKHAPDAIAARIEAVYTSVLCERA